MIRRKKPRPPRTVVLDSEAVDALTDPRHPKHSNALAFVEVRHERAARSEPIRVVTPVAVRVESRWDRRSRGAANLNRLCGNDHMLTRSGADRAAELRRLVPSASAVDATVAEAAEAAEQQPVTIVTSDKDDMDQLAAHLKHPATIAVI